MGGTFRDRHGGIIGLLQLPREQWQAIESDLLDKGLAVSDLFNGRLTWRALAAMVAHSRRDTALMRTVYEEQVAWGPTEQLLADAVDALNLQTWLASDTKKSKRPKPIKRPGVAEEQPTQTFGSRESAVPQSEFWAIWNATNDEGVDEDADPG